MPPACPVEPWTSTSADWGAQSNPIPRTRATSSPCGGLGTSLRMGRGKQKYYVMRFLPVSTSPTRPQFLIWYWGDDYHFKSSKMRYATDRKCKQHYFISQIRNRRYTREFRVEAVKMIYEGGLSVKETCERSFIALLDRCHLSNLPTLFTYLFVMGW